MTDKQQPIGGAIANLTGNRLERFVLNSLNEFGYTLIDRVQFKPAPYLEQPIYSRQYYLGKNIYGTNIYCDFILYHPQKFPDCLVIETKWQQTGGSVDEKFPFLVANIQTKYPYKTILLLDGGGYKPGAAEWLRSQVGNNLLAVFSMAEFQTWVNRRNLG